MQVKLRRGLFWSDGVEFTSADVKATVDTQIKNPGMRFSAVLANNVASVETPDAETVIFKLKKPNSRFHTNFTVRWGAIWILPKHVFEKVEDPAKFDFNKPISLGAYTLHSFDPDGKWYIWQLRDDWQRTSLGRHGKPGPKYLAYIDPGPPDKRVIAQLNHELDVIHDIAPEGMFTLAKQDKGTRAWFKGFPYGHPDPTLPAVIFNTQNEYLKNRDVRWALALMIDVKAVTMAAYRGAATISAIAVPPTGIHPEAYHKPMEAWLKDFEIDTGKSKIKPYDPTVGKQIADMLRPSMGDQIPSDPAVIANSFGLGWWKPNVAAAGELLTRAGFRKQGNQWLTPDGKPFVVRPDGRGRSQARDDAGRHDDRAAMEAGRHRCAYRRSAGHAADPSRRRRFRRLHRLERRDLGRAPGPVLLYGQLALAVRRPARAAAALAQLAALVASPTRQDHRGHPQDRLRRSQGRRARPRLRQADDQRDADHPADGLQRLHGDGSDLLEGLPDRRRPLRQSGHELGQFPLHVRAPEASEVNGAAAPRGSSPPSQDKRQPAAPHRPRQGAAFRIA
jgi:hypothetical protein